MTTSFVDAVAFTATVAGPGSFVYSTPVPSYRTPVQAHTDGDLTDGSTYSYYAVDNYVSPAQREWGHTVYTAATQTFTRSVLGSVSYGVDMGASALTFVTPPTIFLTALPTDVSAGGGGTTRVIASLTATQLNHLHSSPYTLVTAPGLGNMILVHFVVLNYFFNTIPNDGSTNSSVFVGYTGGQILQPGITTGALHSGMVAATSFLAQGVITSVPTLSWSSGQQPAAFTGLDNKALILNCVNDLTLGAIATSSLGVGGAGYAPNDTGVLSNGDSDATYIVNTVGGGGAVVTYTITAAGSDYSVESNSPTSVTTGGGDGNFTINILTITPGDGTLNVIVDYEIIATP